MAKLAASAGGDWLSHEGSGGGLPLGQAAAVQGADVERTEVLGADLIGLVGRQHRGVARAEGGGVQDAVLDQVVAPQHVRGQGQVLLVAYFA